MDELGFTFTVTLKPAYMFLISLEAMQAMKSWAKMIVPNQGYIEVVSMNQDMTVLTSLRMEASAVESDGCAIKVHLPSWTRNLRAAVVRQMEASFRIYKNDDSPNLFCVVGDDSSPIELGKAMSMRVPSGPAIEIPENTPAVHLRAECFREVLNTFGSISNFVSITFKNNSITWSVASEEIEYKSKVDPITKMHLHKQISVLPFFETWRLKLTQDGDYYVEIPGTIRPSMMLLKWQAGSVEALRRASRMTDEVVISPLPRPNWDYNAFHFVLNEGSHFTIAMRRRDFG